MKSFTVVNDYKDSDNGSLPSQLHGKFYFTDILREIVVNLRIVLVSFQILPIYETFDPFLQVSWFYRELKLHHQYVTDSRKEKNEEKEQTDPSCLPIPFAR